MAKDKSRLNWRGEEGVQLKMDWRDHLTSHVMGIQFLELAFVQPSIFFIFTAINSCSLHDLPNHGKEVWVCDHDFSAPE